jgi:RNA polymerase sigma-70 factor (ECF subfamily)
MWRDREVSTEPGDMSLVADRLAAPHEDAERAELIAAVSRAIREELTERQRTVLVAVALDDVPIDVLAERMGATRGALYKTLHDARAKLRAALADRGLAPSAEVEVR